MQITEQSDDRLIFTQHVNENRWIAICGALFFLGMGAYFYTGGDDDARIFAYSFGAVGLFFVVMFFVKPPRAQLIFDRVEGVMILRTPRGMARRVTTVDLSDISGIRLRETNASDFGTFQQVLVQMTKGSEQADIPLPANVSGMSQERILETITDWATRTEAFPSAVDTD